MADTWGENDKLVTDADSDFGSNDEVVQDGPLARGWNKAKQSMSITADLATSDHASAAKTIAEAADYARANPGSKEGARLMEAWERGDGFTGGVSEVVDQIGQNYDDAKGFVPGVKSVAKDVQAMGSGILEQVPNMLAPMSGMIAGGAAGTKTGAALGAAAGAPFAGVGAAPGAAIGGTIGGVTGAWLGSSAGNTAVEGGNMAMEALNEAGIDPRDTDAVVAFLDQNGSQLLKQSAIKGGIIGAVDTATAGIGGRLLNAPARAASDRALTALGVDLADSAAVKAAMSSPQFASQIAGDAAFQASKQGMENVARNTAAFAVDPAGEFAGEYLGTGVATGDWDAKNAGLEALSSVGQSGVMYAGQKAYQYATKPLSGESVDGAPVGADPAIEPQPQGPFPALPAPVYEAGPDGTIRTTGDINAATQAERQAEADRLGRIARGEVTDVTPVPAAPRPSEQMGLDPNAGPMSAAAALAVDSGVSQQAAEQSALQQTKQSKPRQGELIDNETGEIIVDRAAELNERINYIRNQAKSSGWDKRLVEAREQAEAELASLQPQAKAKDAAKQVLAAGGSEADASRAATDSLIGDMDKTPGISISEDAPAAVEAAKQEAPATLKEGISQVRAKKAAAAQEKEPDHPAVSEWMARRLEDFKQRNGIPAGADIEQTIAQNEGSPNAARAGRAAKLRAELRDIEKNSNAARQWLTDNPEQAGQLEPDARLDFANPVSTLDFFKTGVRPSGLVDEAQGIAQSGATPADIKAVIAKQIPDMTDAEIQQAITHYGPENKRTAKLNKELAKRVATPTQQTEIVDGEQAPQTQQAGTQRAQAPRAEQAAVPDTAPADAGNQAVAEDAGSRWDSMTPAERQAVAEKAGVKPVFAKNLPNANWERVGESVREKLSAAMDQPALTYEKAKADADAARARSAQAAKVMGEFGGMANGMTPDSVKSTPEWQAAKAESDAALRAEQQANAVVVKNFPAENRADIRAARESKAAASAPSSTTDQASGGATQATGPSTSQAVNDFIEGRRPDAPTVQEVQQDQGAQEAQAKGPLPIPEKAFADLLAEAGQEEGGIPTFTEPAETVRSEKRAEAAGAISLDDAQARIAEWEAHAKAQGNTGVNAGKVVLSLFDTSGEWSQPWIDAGYDVHRFDIQDGMDINDFSVEYLTETLGIERADIILAAPPCTDFSSSGAHAWKKKDADGRTAASVELVRQTLRTVEFFKPASWALENPVGRIQKLTGLPKPLLTFQPANFGNPYTKRTLLWGDFNADLPLASVDATEGSRITDKLSGKDKYERSLTPKGFAYSFFMANNLADMGAVDLLAREFKGIPKADFQAAADAGMAPEVMRSAIEDSYYDQDLEGARQALRDAMPTEPGPGAKAEPTVAAAPEAETKAKDADRFAGNKIFTADAVAAARARMKSKLGQLNSGIDPELMMDGMTIAGAYIESGVRDFAQYAAMMSEDFGDKIKPYLLSFWEAARNYPGVDKDGMTSAEESARLHSELLTPAVTKAAAEAVGTVAEKPKARTRKTGAKGDMVLTQDWGAEHIDGFMDGDHETRSDTKDAFLKETRNYLNAVADSLRAFGFEPHLDRKGKPEKPVSVNESGPAGSGDVTLVMRNEDNGNNVYITIGDTSLRGVVPSTPSGIALMYRVGPGTDRYASKAGNTWAPVDLSANDLAALVNSRVRHAQKNEGTTNAGTLQTQELPSANQGEAQANAAAGDRDSKPLDDGLAGSRQGADRGERVPAGTAGAGGSRADGVQQSGQSAPGTARDSGSVRTEQQPADPVADPATAETSPKPEIDQPADFNLAGEDIGKGGLTKKYRENIAAIRILKAMESENRVATPEERRQIARYVGWGALKGVFDKDNKQWAKEYAELKELLTDAEYKAARASTLNAHYTSPTVVGGIFEALDQLGFTKGRVLEPSVGTGNFFGLMPAKVRKASQLHGVELDPLTSQIAAALYPSAKIAKATGFQDFQVPAEYFDLAIGNPPFGSEPLVDDDRSPYSGASIHNYFFAKSIDKLRPGGLLSMVVSHNFLDAKNEATRRWISERANLVSAVRLPRTAFKENAGTDVVTDILIFQKKTESERVNGLGDDSWVKTAEVRLTNPKNGEESAHQISSYFEKNPSNVLGTPSAGGSMYRANEYTVEPLERSLEDSLTGWVIGLPQGIYQPVERTHESEAADVSVPDGIKVGSYFLTDNGAVQIRGNDVMGNRTASAWTAPNAKAAERMKGMIGLRDALRAQMRLEKSPEATEEQIEAHRAELNRLYDAFQSKLGFLNDPTNRRIFLDDTESALLLALEFDYDKGVSKAVAEREEIEARAPSAVKADIFKRRVMFPPADNIKVSTAKDSLLASLNYKGRLDLDYMASLYDKPQADILSELGDVVFDDPINGLVMADEYLSGDVKTKLAEAEAAARDNPSYKRSVEALKKVIPADKRPSEIHAALGAPFIPAELFEQFATEVTGATVKAAYIKATGQWIVDARSEASATLNVGKWGISKMPATAILSRTMAGQGVVVTETHRNADGSTTTVVLERETEAAREKQAAMKAEWQRWLWADADRADMVAGIYNEKMNRIVPRQYDGSHMTFPGMSPAIELLPHQKNAVWRALQSRQVLLDHVVGAGKTFEVVALFMEMRRLGIARKPFIAVPNHLTLQWRSEFSRLYPAANVLAATPDDFAKGNREKFFSKIITGDWDAVIVGHSSLKKIALPAETEKAVLEEQIGEIASAIEDMKRARGDRNIIRDMEGIKARLEAKMKQRIQALGERDKVVTFDELGVDAFAVDELHEFKNLFYNSTMERVPGMGNPAGSDKAFDLFVKMQWMFDTLGDKAPITGATGTPVSNSLVEMFNMQRFLQYPMLKREGLHVFDAWAKQFGSVESLYEVSPSGTGYRQSSRFAKFKNLPALMAHYQTFADTVTLDDLKAQEESRGKAFPVPKVAGGRPVNVVAKRSPQVASFMGVPELDVKDGVVQFGFNAARGDEAIIEQNSDGTAWTVQVRSTNEEGQPFTMHLGSAKTEEDARLTLMEAALSPKIKVDPESILGKFGRLRELNKATKGKVNALSLTGQANKAGLDYRLIDPSAPDFSGSKINLAVDRVLATYKQWDADKGTQLVFCDLSVPLSARSGFGAKERRIYVRDNGEIAHKRGTMHTVAGFEELPFFVVKEGGKDAKSFAIYDAATGLRVHSGLPAKGVAIEWAGQILADESKRQRWIDARDNLGDIEQEAIDDYNNANEIDTEESEAISLADIAGVSGAAGFSVYDDIKAKLIAKGIPEREIAFIHDYSTPAAKDKAFKAMNSGALRVMLGSTPKMGAGTNVQKRLVGLHHIDAPWRPSDLEQREGRIIRRGNELYDRDPENFEVGIYRYATEQTYDTRRWQILEHKARGIEQLRKYDGTLNEIDDIEGEAANSADMKAAASGDPLILEETQLRNEVRRLESLQASHADESQSMVRRARDQAKFANEWGPRDLAQFQRLKKDADAHPVKKDQFAGLTVEGREIGDRDKAIQAIKNQMDRVLGAGELDGGTATFTYRGIDFTLTGNSSYAELESPTGMLDNFRAHNVAQPSPAGFLTRFANYINRIPAHIAELEAKIAEAKTAAEELREQSSKPFTQEEELSAAREAHKRVQRRLIAKGPDIPAAQRPMLEQAMDQQKVALREQGFGESLDEFLGSNQDRLRYSFAGRGAQGADLLSLSTAQRRIASGDNAETVRQETGWHRGADGKWRFEVSDHQASLIGAGKNAGSLIDTALLNAITDGRNKATIADVLDHPQLFAAYPGLRNLAVQKMPAGEQALARVRRLATGPVIQLRSSMSRDQVVSVLLHELQHVVQIQEGFAMGGSAKKMTSELDPTGAATYRRLAGEVEARNTQERQKMSPRVRREIGPDESADTPAGEVIVTFNGKDVAATPANAKRTAITSDSLTRAFDLQFQKLGKAVRTMLARGKQNKRGGLVILESADPLQIASEFSRRTGRSLDHAIEMFDDAGTINGFFDPRSGLTFLVGPNLNVVTGPAVLLHEMTHGQQRKKLDERAGAMLMNRGQVKNADLRAFLDRVVERMIDAGESTNMQEAAAYIVEQAIIEGRSQGYSTADNRFLAWVDQSISKQVGDFLRSFLGMVRSWMLRNGMGIGEITVDDLVGYAMAGMSRAARGKVGDGGLAFSRDAITNSPAFKRWFGDSKVVDADGKPLVVYHGAANFDGNVFRPVATTNRLGNVEGFYFGDADRANQFASAEGGEVIPVYLSITNPFVPRESKVGRAMAAAYRDALREANPSMGEQRFNHWADGKVEELLERRRVDVTALNNRSDLYQRTLRAGGYDGMRDGDDWVAFRPEQIKSATGNNGDFDPSNPDIRFSRSGVRELASRATSELNKTFNAPGKLSKWHTTVGTMYNLAERSAAFKPVFEAAQGFIDDVAHYAADAAEHAPKLLPRLETWRDIAKKPISAEDNTAIAKPIFEGTLMWTRDDEGNPTRVQSLAEAASNLTADEKAEILLAQGKIPEGMLKAWRGLPAEQFSKMIDSRYESQFLKPGIVWTAAELRSIFTLTDPQIALYREFREATNRSLDTMARADLLRFGGEDVKDLRGEVMNAKDVREAAMLLRDHLAEMADRMPDRAAQLLQTAHGMVERADKVGELQAEGYAPLSRFGKYTVDVVENGERQYFGLFETKREANQMAEQMRAEFGQDSVTQGTLSDESFKLFAGITPESLELFGNMLGLDSTGDSAQDQAFQEYLRLTKTNRSAMRRLIHRKGIAGYSEDVGRVLASFVYSNARQTAAGLNMGDLGDAVSKIPKEQGELKDVAVRLGEYIKNPQEEAQAVRGLLFAQYLGGSVASAFVNMTQPFAVSFPWLSQYGGARKAASQLARAAKQMSTRGFKYEDDLAVALKAAEDDGTVSPQEVHQLMAQARGSGSLRAGDGTKAGEARAIAANSIARLSVAWGKLFGAAEQVNRRITFIAAYRTAKEQGLANPEEFARRAVKETQFIYSKASKMQWGRGAVGGTLMTFKTYSIAYMELMHRLWNQGEAGSQERKDGRKAAMLMIATLLLMGGAGGLPFAEDAEDLIDGAAQLMGYNFSLKKSKEAFLRDVFGEGLAEFIDKGVSGLPGAPLDVSGRLGMGNLIPGTGLFQERTSHTRDVLEIAGPGGDFASRILSGGRKILGGDIGAGLLEVSPVAVRNAAKGLDMGVTGMYRDTKGYKVLDANLLESALKAVGFQPAGVAKVQEANWLNQRSKNFYSMKAQEIRAQWAAGIFEKDPAKVQRARDAVAEWNRKNPDQPMTIKIPDVMRRVREMSKTKDQRIADTAPKAMRAQMREDAARVRSSLE